MTDTAGMPALTHDPAQSTSYRVAPGIQWVVGHADVLVRHPSGGITRVAYPEAALWDLVSRGQAAARIHRVMKHVAGLDDDGATALIGTTLDEWHAMGFVLSGRADG